MFTAYQRRDLWTTAPAFDSGRLITCSFGGTQRRQLLAIPDSAPALLPVTVEHVLTLRPVEAPVPPSGVHVH